MKKIKLSGCLRDIFCDVVSTEQLLISNSIEMSAYD